MQVFNKLRQSKGPDPVESPRLTPDMVTQILQMNESDVNLKTTESPDSIIKEVHCNQLQANKPIEDRRVEAHLTGSDRFLFGVFDGHAGCACAQALKNRLFQYIAVAMADPTILSKLYETELRNPQLLELLATSSKQEISPDLAKIHQESLLNFVNDCLDMHGVDDMVYTGTQVEEYLINAFTRLDRDISLEPSNYSSRDVSSDLINIAFSGSVGVVAYVDGLDLYVANVGDCQAVVGSRESGEKDWTVTPVSFRHDAENPSEVQRLFSRHPNESNNILRGGRLFGELMPLRAFGDNRYKWSRKELMSLKEAASKSSDDTLQGYKNYTIQNSYRTPPYLDAEPQVVRYRLSPKDRFLVLATDGLWDSDGMTVEKVVSLVGHHSMGQQSLTRYRPSEGTNLQRINEVLKKRKENLSKRTVDKNSATHLLRHALGLEHGSVSAQLTLPEKLVRYYRDDITITVVYFDPEYLMNYHANPDV